MKILKPSVPVLFGLIHAYMFSFTWAVLGARTGFLVLGATNSFLMSTLASTATTTLVVTSPMALLAGRISGQRFLILCTLSFALAWAALNAWYAGAHVLASGVTIIPLAMELVAISLVTASFFALGFRLRTVRPLNSA